MLGHKSRDQLEVLVTGSLQQLVLEDHVLARVDRVLDLGWLRVEVVECYCADNGRPGIDPEVAVRLMLAGLLLGIVHDRRLMREAQVNIAIRWFIGYGLHERLPDHSSLTSIRQRWGEERFRKIFQRTVTACLDAQIATAEVVHIDASLIRADVSWESLVERHVSDVVTENRNEEEIEVEKRGRQSGKYKKVSRTDADASMATTARNRRLEPCYKQHTAVDDVRGVVLDVAVTTGEVNEGDTIEAQVDAVQEIADRAIATVTADAGYAYGKVYGGFERRGIDPLIPAKREPIKSRVPLRRFRYDARHDIVRCPRGKVLRPGRALKYGRFFQSRARSVRRRKVCAAKLIADGLWVDLRRGKYDPIRQLRVGTPDADHVSCLPAGPTLAFAAGLAGVGSPRTPGSSRQRCGRCTGLDGVLCALRGGRSTQRPLRAVDDGQGADLCLRDGHILLARGGEEAGGGCSVSDARGGQLPATSHGM